MCIYMYSCIVALWMYNIFLDNQSTCVLMHDCTLYILVHVLIYLHFNVCFLHQIPDQDLHVRRVDQKVDPLSGELFIHIVYDPPPTVEEEEGKEEGVEEEEEERDEGEEEGEKDKKVRDEFEEDLVSFHTCMYMHIKETLSWWGQTSQRSLDNGCFELNVVSSHQQGTCIPGNLSGTPPGSINTR